MSVRCEVIMNWAIERKIGGRCTRQAKRVVDGRRLCAFHANRMEKGTMERVYRVVAEMHDGGIVTLRKGFASEDDALSHPVRLSHWKRVWVEEDSASVPRGDSPPPFPWSVLWVGGFAYVVDAGGKKIASLLGTQARREYVADILCSLGPETAGE